MWGIRWSAWGGDLRSGPGRGRETTAVTGIVSGNCRENRAIPGVGVPPSGGPSIPFPDRLKAGLQPGHGQEPTRVPASDGPWIRERRSSLWSGDPRRACATVSRSDNVTRVKGGLVAVVSSEDSPFFFSTFGPGLECLSLEL